MKIRILLKAMFPLILMGCNTITGEEVARLPINQVSIDDDNLIIQEASLELEKGQDLSIWSEVDMKYDGDVLVRFRLEILKDGEEYGGLEIDPTDKSITIGEVKTSFMDKTNWRFTGKNGKIEIKEKGNYTIKAILVASDNPTLEISKAELIFKL